MLSNAGEDAFDAIGNGDASRWFVAWRNGSNQAVVIEMPHGDLRQQTRTDFKLETGVVAFLHDIAAGSDPALIWNDYVALHATFLSPRFDVLLDSNGPFFEARVIGSNIFWKSLRANFRILSSQLSRSPAAPIERACLGSAYFAVDYDTRDDEIAALAYVEGTRVRVQLPSSSRRRS